MQSSENENSNNEFTNSAFRGEEQEDADLTELTEISEPEAGSSQGKSIGTCTLLILSNENLDAIDDLLLSSFFFLKNYQRKPQNKKKIVQVHQRKRKLAPPRTRQRTLV